MYDAIVVGARCAGSPTAMLLARKGHKVLLVDRAGFPSDTLSTHYIHQSGIAHLERWGLLPRIVAAGAPAIRNYTLDVGPFALHGAPPPLGSVADAYSLKRTVLDEILIEAAAEAGAEVRQSYPVDGLAVDGDRVIGIHSRGRTERARMVIGADGANSLVARSVGAPVYNDAGTLTCAYYAYFRGVEMGGAELYVRPGRMIVAAPTNDGQVVIIVFWPNDEFHAVRADVERRFMAALELAPTLAARVRGGERADRFRGTSRLPNRYRRPYGPGWALVGDAGLVKDPILAVGIGDAFRDAELLAEAIETGDLGGYERRRNERSAHSFQSTLDFARLAPPAPEMQELFAELLHNARERNRFFGVIAGTVAPEDFTPLRRPAAPSAAA
jgi:2-polyprenyl-6-methoxyphenol hydroxylase-like FAD-dependent oxidoreductase